MTLNEAIKHCHEVVAEDCTECGREHLQLAKWLEDLKTFYGAGETKDIYPGLNELAQQAYNNAKKREENGANITVDTRKMLKHTATEVVEAMEAYTKWEGMYTEQEFTEGKGHFASELADIICCALIIAHREYIDIEQALAECMEKNRKRAEGLEDKL